MLTVKEVAELLRISEFTIRELARNGKIQGATKIGGEWRFSRQVIDAMVQGEAANG